MEKMKKCRRKKRNVIVRTKAKKILMKNHQMKNLHPTKIRTWEEMVIQKYEL